MTDLEKQKESILVCLSSSPSNVKVIYAASELCQGKNTNLIAIYVSNQKNNLKDYEQQQLDKNIAFAKELGADIEIIYADDIANQIIRFAHLYKINKIVVGKNKKDKRWSFSSSSLCYQIMEQIEGIDLVVVPVKAKKPLPKIEIKKRISSQDIFISSSILVFCTIIGYFFFEMGFHDSNIIMAYILGVLLIALMTTNRLCSIVSSIISVILFNFCFTFPTMSLSFYDSSYLMTFFIMIIVAFLISTLTNRIQQNAFSSSNMAHISKILLETNQILQKNSTATDIIYCGCKQLSELLNRDIVYYTVDNNKLNEPILIPIQGKSHINECLDTSEKGVAQWVAIHNKHAGATTRYLSGAKCLYYAIRTEEKIYGVIGIYLSDERLDSLESRILLAVLGEMALCLENIKNIQDKNEAILKVKKEQLRADLLRSISHDLRTPLTSIYGNSDILLKDSGYLTEEKKKVLYTNIYDDSLWLINLVENLLSITKIEDGKMRLRIEPQMIEEVVSEAMEHISRNKDEHHIIIKIEKEYLMADMDARLIIQVLINIINNAIKYTPIGSKIEIVAYQKDETVFLEVRDNGNGILDKDKEKIFEKFYSLNNSIVDSKRSMGLGLSLCKSIVEAHGGKIYVSDNNPQGTVFTFTLPATKVFIDEDIM